MEKQKERFLKALRKTKGVISSACEALEMSRQTFYNWKEADEEFATAYEDILDEGLDYAEGVVFRCMKMAEPIPQLDKDKKQALDKDGQPLFDNPNFKDMAVALDAAEFFLERKGKKRGYSIRTEIDDITERERLRVADLFPDEETLNAMVKEHEEQKKIDQKKPSNEE